MVLADAPFREKLAMSMVIACIGDGQKCQLPRGENNIETSQMGRARMLPRWIADTRTARSHSQHISRKPRAGAHVLMVQTKFGICTYTENSQVFATLLSTARKSIEVNSAGYKFSHRRKGTKDFISRKQFALEVSKETSQQSKQGT